MNLENFPVNETANEMISMLSGGWYENSYVGKWIFEVMGREMEDAKSLCMDLQQQVFPELASWGLIYHKIKHGISGGDSLDQEELRQMILSRRDSKGSMNPGKLRQIAESISKKEVEIEERTAPYTFLVKVMIRDSHSDFNEKALRQGIIKAKPSHMAYELVTERPFLANVSAAAIMQQSNIVNLRQVI